MWCDTEKVAVGKSANPPPFVPAPGPSAPAYSNPTAPGSEPWAHQGGQAIRRPYSTNSSNSSTFNPHTRGAGNSGGSGASTGLTASGPPSIETSGFGQQQQQQLPPPPPFSQQQQQQPFNPFVAPPVAHSSTSTYPHSQPAPVRQAQAPPTLPAPYDYQGSPQPNVPASGAFGARPSKAQTAPHPTMWRPPTVVTAAPPPEEIVDPTLPPPAKKEDVIKLVECLRLKLVADGMSDSDFVAFVSALMYSHPNFTDFVEKKMLFKRNTVARKRHDLSLTQGGAYGGAGIQQHHGNPPPALEKEIRGPSKEEMKEFYRTQQLDLDGLAPLTQEAAELLIRGI